MRSTRILSAGALSVLLLGGCAAMFNGTTDSIQVRSDVPGTTIYANDERIGGQSAAFKANKKDDYFIRVEKPGCEPKTVAVEKTFDATSLLGLLIDGGVISILAVDWGATGAVNKAKQTHYTINPICNTEQLSGSDSAELAPTTESK